MTTTREPLFYALELDVYQPGTTAQPYTYGRAVRPRGALTVLPSAADSSSDTLRASDLGYRSRASDTIGLKVYPPVMDQAFSIDRHLALDPGQPSTATYGSVQLDNLDQRFDSYVQGRNCDSRSAKLLMGQKTRDAARGTLVDPAYATLSPFFGGFARPWQLNEAKLEIPLADATYWADRPLQSSFYSGAGGLGGSAELAGLPLPTARGGTGVAPIQNVPLVTVDPVNLIFQWTDGPGAVVALYEGGAPVFVYDGDVSDLYAGATPSPGHYRTNNARGLLQMGSQPVKALTVDCTGSFLSAGAVTTAVAIARYVLTETMAQPSALLDLASFTAVDAAYPYQAGFWVGTTATSGLGIVQGLLGSVGARMISGRNGLVKVVPLRPLSSGDVAAIALSMGNVVNVTTQALPSTLDPPPYRWRVGYGQRYSVQTSDYEGAITEARKAIVAQQWSIGSWSSSDVLAAWRRPNDPPIVTTYLTSAADAASLAAAQGTLWQSRPGMYAVEVPMDIAAQVDVGSKVGLTWPLGELQSGKMGQIVGEQIRSYDGTCVFTILMSPVGFDPPFSFFSMHTADSTTVTADSTAVTADMI